MENTSLQWVPQLGGWAGSVQGAPRAPGTCVSLKEVTRHGYFAWEKLPGQRGWEEVLVCFANLDHTPKAPLPARCCPS